MPWDVTPNGIKLGSWVSVQRKNKSKNLLSQDRIACLEALSGWSWDLITEQWEEAFEHLQFYVKLHGNARVRSGHVTSDGFKLGSWVSFQRKNQYQNLLSQDRVERLESLPGWSWDPITQQWEEAFEHLQTYVKLHGNSSVYKRYVTSDGLILGSWVGRQRKNKSQNLLSQDRIERLEALSGWYWDPLIEQWEEAFGQLQSYVKQHGNARVPQRYVITDGLNLGTWVGTQRLNKSKNLLSQDRIGRLEAIPGWSWDPLTEQLEEAFEQLQSYVQLHGNARVPNRYVTSDGFNLGTWVQNQRQNKSKNLLNQDRIAHLEALSGWSWDPLTQQWEEAFEQLQSYVKLHGNSSVYKSYVIPDGLNLGTWVGTQRVNKSQNSLSQDRIARLEALPGWSWDPLTDQWEKAFEELQLYVKRHDNAKVPLRYVIPDGFNLGRWVGVQRKNKSKNLLSQDRIDRLEALSGWVWSLK